MRLIEWLCATLGINKSAFLSGLLGGVFSLRWVPQVGWLGVVSAVLFAGLTANYATAPIHRYFATTGLHEGAVGFFVGLFAMSTSAAIFKAMSELQLGGLLAEAARRILGGRP